MLRIMCDGQKLYFWHHHHQHCCTTLIIFTCYKGVTRVLTPPSPTLLHHYWWPEFQQGCYKGVTGMMNDVTQCYKVVKRYHCYLLELTVYVTICYEYVRLCYEYVTDDLSQGLFSALLKGNEVRERHKLRMYTIWYTMYYTICYTTFYTTCYNKCYTYVKDTFCTAPSALCWRVVGSVEGARSDLVCDGVIMVLWRCYDGFVIVLWWRCKSVMITRA
jgi:hypothetical protein